MRNALLYVLSALSVSVCIENSDGMVKKKEVTYSYEEARTIFRVGENLLKQVSEISVENTKDIDNLASVYRELLFRDGNIDWVKGHVFSDMMVATRVKEGLQTRLTHDDVQALQRLEATLPDAIRRKIEDEDKDLALALSLEFEENAAPHSPQAERVPPEAEMAGIAPEIMQAIQFVTNANSKATEAGIFEYIRTHPYVTAEELIEEFLIMH